MNRLLLLFLLLSFSLTSTQVRFGKVSKEELQLSQSDMDAEAPAEIISKVGRYEVRYSTITSEFEVQKEVEVRIKVYDKDKTPDRFLNVVIPAYIIGGSNKEKISNIRASTYNLEGGKIEESKLSRLDIFKEKMSDYLELEKFAFPNVKSGSILEYKYTIITTRFFDLDTWFIQSEIPVKYNRFYVMYPEFFVYKQDRRGEFTKNIKSDRKPTDFKYSNVVDEIIYKNVPALREEPFVQNSDNLRTSIRYELQEFNNPGFGYQNFSLTWSQIVKDLFDNSSYGGELKGNNFLKDDVEKFMNLDKLEEKMSAIFQFVQQNYTWNGMNGLYPEKGTRKTYKEKSGNGSDLNFILISMLQRAGLQAYPIVLSTVENGMLNYFPSKQKLNHTITGVMINNEVYIMDPTEKFSKINMLPTRDLNFIGYMVMDGGSYKEIELVNKQTSEVKNSLNFEILDDIVEGVFIQTKSNYFAMRDLNSKIKDESNFKKKYLSSYDLDATDFEFKENITGDAIRYQVKFQDSKAIETIGNKLFIKPLLFTSQQSNAFNFKNEERKYPLEFGTPFTYLTRAQFTIPEGYKVESLPDQQNLLLPQNAGGYDIKFSQEYDKIVVQSLLHVGYSVLPQSFYVDVKNMFQKMIESENQQIILQKE